MSFVSRRLRVTLELDALFEDRGVSWLAFHEMFALVWAPYRRCLPAQPILSALQRYNRWKCAHLLRDLAATVDLPPHSAFFSLQFLGPGSQVVRKGSQRHPPIWLPQSTSRLNWTQRRLQIHFNSQSSATRSTIGRLADGNRQTPRHQLHNAPSLHTAWTIQQIVTEEYRILEVLNFELATHTPAAWIEVFGNFSSRNAPLFSLVPPDVLAHGAEDIAEVYVRRQPFTVDSRPSQVGASAWFLSCAFLDQSPTSRSSLEVTQRRFVLSGHAPPHLIPSFCA